MTINEKTISYYLNYLRDNPTSELDAPTITIMLQAFRGYLLANIGDIDSKLEALINEAIANLKEDLQLTGDLDVNNNNINNANTINTIDLEVNKIVFNDGTTQETASATGDSKYICTCHCAYSGDTITFTFINDSELTGSYEVPDFLALNPKLPILGIASNSSVSDLYTNIRKATITNKPYFIRGEVVNSASSTSTPNSYIFITSDNRLVSINGSSKNIITSTITAKSLSL